MVNSQNIQEKFRKDEDGFSVKIDKYTYFTLKRLNKEIEDTLLLEFKAKFTNKIFTDDLINRLREKKDFYSKLREDLINYINEY